MNNKRDNCQEQPVEPDDSYNGDLYGREFYEQWGIGNAEYLRSAREVADIIHTQYQPASVLDLGCGAGLHAERLMELGVEVICADAHICPPDLRPQRIKHVEQIDLMQGLADGYFIIPYTLGGYLAGSRQRRTEQRRRQALTTLDDPAARLALAGR